MIIKGHGREAIALSKMQETTAQLEHQRNIKQIELEMENIKAGQMQRMNEEKRKTLQEETRQAQARAEYQDQLARKRSAILKAYRYMNFPDVICWTSIWGVNLCSLHS